MFMNIITSFNEALHSPYLFDIYLTTIHVVVTVYVFIVLVILVRMTRDYVKGVGVFESDAHLASWIRILKYIPLLLLIILWPIVWGVTGVHAYIKHRRMRQKHFGTITGRWDRRKGLDHDTLEASLRRDPKDPLN